MIQADVRMPTREGVIAGADAIAAILPPTPLLPVDINGVHAWTKAEVLQPVGAFKIRGAWWRYHRAIMRKAWHGRRGGWVFALPS